MKRVTSLQPRQQNSIVVSTVIRLMIRSLRMEMKEVHIL